MHQAALEVQLSVGLSVGLSDTFVKKWLWEYEMVTKTYMKHTYVHTYVWGNNLLWEKKLKCDKTQNVIKLKSDKHKNGNGDKIQIWNCDKM